MRKTDSGTGKIINKLLNIKIEEDYHRSPLQRLLHILCFISPVAAAFAGYFISSPLWNFCYKKFCSNQAKFQACPACPEWYKFALSVFLFCIVIIVIFVKTRNTNPTMKIRVSNIQNQLNQNQTDNQ